MLLRQKTFLYCYLDKKEMCVKSINYCSHRQKHLNIGWTSERMDWEMVSLAPTSGLNEISRRRNGRKQLLGLIFVLTTKVQWKRWINGQWAISLFFHREWAISKAWVRWREYVRAIFPNFTLCRPKEDECDACFAINIELGGYARYATL